MAESIPGVKHIIAVSSGKGGVGKSTVSANLAVALAKEGKRVGLLDADIHGPNMPTMMGVTDNPVIEKDEQGNERFVPPQAHGVKVMSMGFLLEGDQPVIWRGPMLHNVLQQFARQVRWGDLDYLVMDMPPGTGDVQLSVAQLMPITAAILVTTPQEVAMQDVRKAINMWEKVKVPMLGVVENMSYFEAGGEKHFIFGEGGGQRLAEKFNTKLLGQFPVVQAVREAGDEGAPITVRDEASDVANRFRELARTTVSRVARLESEGVDPSQIMQIGRFD